MTVKKILQLTIGIALTPILLNLNFDSAIAQQRPSEEETSESENAAPASGSVQQVEASVTEDDLETRGGMPWGGRDWPYSKVVEIKDSLVDSAVGRVVMDKYGEDNSSTSWLFKEPSILKPGKTVLISLWGSKIEGCFAELIVQVAPDGPVDPQTLIPSVLEMGVGGQIVQLTPQNASPKIGTADYTYEENDYTYSATWYMARHLFVMDAATAGVLSNAPAQEIKARITFANNNSVVFPIGKGTVERWKAAYSFNPACGAPTQAQPSGGGTTGTQAPAGTPSPTPQ